MSKKATLSSIIVIAIIATVSLIMLSTQNESPPTISDKEQNESVTKNSDLTGYKMYTNDEIGISFEYPDVFQRVGRYPKFGTPFLKSFDNTSTPLKKSSRA